MAWYPDAIRKEIPPKNDPPIKVVGAILHVDAGNSASLFDFFNGPSGGIESHFHIQKKGGVEQYRDTGFEADANLKANSFLDGRTRKGFVSIETQGLERGEWTDQQLTSIKTLLEWLSKEHDFPLRKCPGPFTPGVGFHVLFGAPGPWTPVAKSCPGPDRVAQFHGVLVPWFAKVNPDDDHNDPGEQPVWQPGDGFPGRAAFVLGRRHPAVTVLGQRLKAAGFDRHHDGDGYQPDPVFTSFDRANVADFQRSLGFTGADADGFPGPTTWRLLAEAT